MADVIAGHEGRVVLNGATLICERFRVRSTATEVPANDFESRNRKSTAGLVGAEVEIFGYWDRDSNPVTVHSVKAGAENLACIGYLVKGGLAFTFTSINIFDVEVSDEVDSRAELTIRGKTSGSWTYPGGTAAV